ncbi:hypothetical protein AU476_33650 [Cupriavidus sp. UYMSc13B]|nr:hypothetical protein AU476_33650 [Cupriavidus sp. UYMSc13B]
MDVPPCSGPLFWSRYVQSAPQSWQTKLLMVMAAEPAGLMRRVSVMRSAACRGAAHVAFNGLAGSAECHPCLFRSIGHCSMPAPSRPEVDRCMRRTRGFLPARPSTRTFHVICGDPVKFIDMPEWGLYKDECRIFQAAT